jgi:two-component system sensor histidine kinase UhpB
LSLFWRLFLLNGAVFTLGTVALAISPATVSAPVVVHEAVVLAVGLSILLAANGFVLRASLAPLRRLTRLMEEIDVLRPGQRLQHETAGELGELLTTFNRMVARLESERGTSAAAALWAQEAERARIAQELHDEIGQRLTVILLGLKRIADRMPADGREEILALREGARATLDEVGQVARRLRPGVLDDLGLISALTALATEFSHVTGIPVRRRLDPGVTGLSREVELVLYRIAQESLTNAGRHAGASAVTLSLRRNGGWTRLEVQDDGKGLGGAPEGTGIRGMRERAMLIGAGLRLESPPGGGTRMTLLVPSGEEQR